MINAILDLKITVRGDESIVREIYDSLTEGGANTAAIEDKLSDTLQQAIADSQVSGDFEVEVSCGDVHRTFERGGLNAREWMETKTPPQDIKKPKGISSDYQD